MNKEEFINNCNNLNISITEDLYEKLEKYYEMLVDWNNKFNMTTIIEKDDVFLLHFYDSLCLNKAVDLNKKLYLCDFGTGAGFPGMVIALLYPNIKVTLIESNQKKCIFLNEIKKELSVNNVEIINDRIENYSLKNRECFDIITCRAVTSIPIILEISISSLKLNGILVPLKSNCDEEIKKYKYLENKLGINLINKIDYRLPINDASRTIPVYKKLKETDKKYPRNYNQIKKTYINKC